MKVELRTSNKPRALGAPALLSTEELRELRVTAGIVPPRNKKKTTSSATRLLHEELYELFFLANRERSFHTSWVGSLPTRTTLDMHAPIYDGFNRPPSERAT